MTASSPLGGLRVLDLSQGIAGPYCAGLFAEYGASVIKIEPPKGDWMRPLGAGSEGNSASFLFYNRGKRSLALDLKADGAIEIVLSLARQADVFIHNNRPGVAERLGFGFDALKALQPKIIYVSVSGLGQTGPDNKMPLTDTVAQARSGLMSINTGRSGVPGRVDTTIIDAITGLYGFQAATMALWGPTETREAQHVDVSLLQSAAAIQAPKIMEFGLLGRPPQKLNAPAGSFPSSDGYFAISLVRETEWQTICKLIGRMDLCEGRFATFPDRAPLVEELNTELDAIFKAKPTQHWVDLLGGEGILIAPIYDHGTWLTDRQTVATNGAPKLPVSQTDQGPLVRTPGHDNYADLAPRLGEHSRAILSEAGLGDDKINAMITAGVVIEDGSKAV